MNVGIIYAITSFVSLLQIALVLNRTLATEYKETIEAPFCRMLYLFLAFCVADILWGLSFSRLLWVSPIAFTLISYGYHSMGALSAFIWYGYIIYYVKAEGKEKKCLNILRFALMTMQLCALVSNVFTHEAFYVNEDGTYVMGSLRMTLYLLQFSYYGILLVYCFYKFFSEKTKRTVFRNAAIFSLIPLLFGIGQYVFYDVAMYAFGFMISGFMIYSFNLTAQREAYLQEKNTKLREDVYLDALTGLYNRRAYEDDIKMYSAGMMEDFVYMTLDVNGLKETNDTLGHDAGDELIEGTAFCMRTCLGSYGKLYRIGGDEFVAMIYVATEKLEGVLADFDCMAEEWKGKKNSKLSVSYGYVTKQEQPDIVIEDMARLADKRMYQAKASYYQNQGTDRRGLYKL